MDNFADIKFNHIVPATMICIVFFQDDSPLRLEKKLLGKIFGRERGERERERREREKATKLELTKSIVNSVANMFILSVMISGGDINKQNSAYVR